MTFMVIPSRYSTIETLCSYRTISNMNIEPSMRKLNYLLIVLTCFSRIANRGAGKADEEQYIPLHCTQSQSLRKNFWATNFATKCKYHILADHIFFCFAWCYGVACSNVDVRPVRARPVNWALRLGSATSFILLILLNVIFGDFTFTLWMYVIDIDVYFYSFICLLTLLCIFHQWCCNHSQ